MRRERNDQTSNSTNNNDNQSSGSGSTFLNASNGAVVLAANSNMFGNALAVPSHQQRIRYFDSKAKDCRRLFINLLPFDIKEEEVRRVVLAKASKVRRDMINQDRIRHARATMNNNSVGAEFLDEAASLLNNSNAGTNNNNNNNSNNELLLSGLSTEKKKKLSEYILREDAVVDMDVIVEVVVHYPTNRSKPPYAFVEFLLDDIVTKFINDDIEIEFVQEATSYSPRQIIRSKCRRPQYYVPMSGIDDTKIYVAGIPNAPSLRKEFEEYFKEFGDVTSFSAVGGVGFYVEFHEASSAKKAVQAMCGQVFNERAVYCNYATEALRIWLLNRGIEVTGIFDDTELFEIASSGANLDFKYSNSTIFAPDPLRDFYGDLFKSRMSLTQVLANFVHTQKHLRKSWPVVTPTRILVLMNLFDPDVEFPSLNNTESNRQRQIQEFRTEIEEEVEQYGRVRHLFLITDPPKPPTMPTRNQNNNTNTNDSSVNDAAERLLNNADDDNNSQNKKLSPEEEKKQFDRMMFEWHKQKMHPVFGETGVGKVFVEYETVKEAEAAQAAISGRLFNGRTVITSYLFEDVLYPDQEINVEMDAAAAGDDTNEGETTTTVDQVQQEQQVGQDAAGTTATATHPQETTKTSLEDEMD